MPNATLDYQEKHFCGRLEERNCSKFLCCRHYPPPTDWQSPPSNCHPPLLGRASLGYKPFLSPPRRSSPVRPPSPLPGSDEYMERDISEKSAFIKRTLEMDGPDVETYQEPNVTSELPTDMNFNPAEAVSSKCVNSSENVSSHRMRSGKQRSRVVADVNEIHNQIVNHISNLSMGKKIELVNQLGSTGYDLAIERIQRQKRAELSKLLRDMCNDSMRYVYYLSKNKIGCRVVFNRGTA